MTRRQIENTSERYSFIPPTEVPLQRAVAASSSTRSPVAEEVTHREWHALVSQNAVCRGRVIKEVGNRERDEKLVTAGAHRTSGVLNHDLSIETGLEIAW